MLQTTSLRIAPPALVAITLSLLAACATGPKRADVDAVRDYIEVAELERPDEIRTTSLDGPSIDPLNEYFLLYETRRGTYLVETKRRCYELYDNTRITADTRRDSSRIRAGFDTIRGCHIEGIYAVNEGQALELKNLGDAPGEESPD